jgi:hypothetical protein
VDVLIRTERHPACRQHETRPGSCTERENLSAAASPVLLGDVKGEATSG